MPDYLGMFAVTAGIGADELAREFEREHDDYNAIMVKALADRLAEAFAEYLHAQARKDWGYGERETLPCDDSSRRSTAASGRPSAIPRAPTTARRSSCSSCSTRRRQGITLTDTPRCCRRRSVSGLYFSHPQAKYFNIGRVGRDQAETYARRKGVPLEEVERWLAPNLSYDPGEAADDGVAGTTTLENPKREALSQVLIFLEPPPDPSRQGWGVAEPNVTQPQLAERIDAGALASEPLTARNTSEGLRTTCTIQFTAAQTITSRTVPTIVWTASGASRTARNTRRARREVGRRARRPRMRIGRSAVRAIIAWGMTDTHPLSSIPARRIPRQRSANPSTSPAKLITRDSRRSDPRPSSGCRAPARPAWWV